MTRHMLRAPSLKLDGAYGPQLAWCALGIGLPPLVSSAPIGSSLSRYPRRGFQYAKKWYRVFSPSFLLSGDETQPPSCGALVSTTSPSAQDANQMEESSAMGDDADPKRTSNCSKRGGPGLTNQYHHARLPLVAWGGCQRRNGTEARDTAAVHRNKSGSY